MGEGKREGGGGERKGEGQAREREGGGGRVLLIRPYLRPLIKHPVQQDAAVPSQMRKERGSSNGILRASLICPPLSA